MFRIFQSRFVVALAAIGICALASSRSAFGQATFGQTSVSDSQAFAYQAPAPAIAPQPSVPATPPAAAPAPAVPNAAAPTPSAPNAGVPSPGNVAEAPISSTPGLAGAAGATQSFSLAPTPNMIGDLLGSNYQIVLLKETGMAVYGASLPLAGGDRIEKISEDTSPIPTDRVFADFNHFTAAAITSDGRLIDVNRYTVGIEKTFFDGICSIEVRAPIENGLSSNQSNPPGPNDNEGTVLGDVSITAKCLVARSDTWAASVGLQLCLPTAPDVSDTPVSFEVVSIKNDSVHLEPFVGLLLTPNCRLFSISYLQFDFDANGDPVTLQMLPGGPVMYEGRLRDPTFMYVDMSVGYWLFDARNESRCAWLLGGVSGIAPIVEMHYTTSLQAFSTHVATITTEFAREDILDMTGGLAFQLGPCSNLTLGACAAANKRARQTIRFRIDRPIRPPLLSRTALARSIRRHTSPKRKRGCAPQRLPPRSRFGPVWDNE